MIYCIDVETTGPKWTTDRVFGVAVAHPVDVAQLLADPAGAPVRSEYFDVRANPGRYHQLADDVRNTNARLVNHNVKFDLHMLANDGVRPDPATAECTMIRASLIDEHLMSYSLDSLATKYLGMAKAADIYPALADLFGGRPTRNAQMPNLHRAPAGLVEPYARRDAELALRLWAWQEAEIDRQRLRDVYRLECRLFPHVFRMERHGIRVDADLASTRAEQMDVEHGRLVGQLRDIAGFDVNPSSPLDMHKLFAPRKDGAGWVAADGTRLESTAGGKASINADALERMRHPAAATILRMRKIVRTKDTFIRGHVLGYEHNGRVHPNINQVKGDETGGTGTGRLSYVEPALQQIPSRDVATAELVRPIFLPDDGQGWSYGDLDQHELRIFHHYVNNPRIIRAYQGNPDLDGHGIVAELTGLPRNAPKSGGANAKQMNLGMVFNMGGGAMAEQMGMSYTVETFTNRNGDVHEYKKPGPEAQAIIDRYYEMVPGVKELAHKASSIAKTRGYVRTLFGRHIRFPGKQFTHKASGLVYQGTSADLNKDNIIRICEYLAAECPNASLLLNIHDEYSVSIPPGADHHLHELKRLVQNRPEIRVPIRIDFSFPAANWWLATKAEVVTRDDQ